MLPSLSSAIMPHLWGIQGTLLSVINNPFGYGLGTGGNIAYINNYSFSSSSDWLSNGGETGLLNLIYQMGLGFFILFMILFLYPSIRLSKTTIKSDYYSQNILLSYAIVALLMASLFQENTFTPQCISLFFGITGLHVGKMEIMQKNERKRQFSFIK